MGIEDYKVLECEDSEFGSYVAYKRDYLGLEEKEMADVLGLTKDIYSRLEKGEPTLVNKDDVDKLLREMVKIKSCNKDKDYLLRNCCNRGREIKDLHSKGLNIVQISVKLGIDEVYIEIYLIENGLSPLFFERVLDVPQEVVEDAYEEDVYESDLVEILLDYGVGDEESLDIVYEYEDLWREQEEYSL